MDPVGRSDPTQPFRGFFKSVSTKLKRMFSHGSNSPTHQQQLDKQNDTSHRQYKRYSNDQKCFVTLAEHLFF
jgi:hypothetical protein